MKVSVSLSLPNASRPLALNDRIGELGGRSRAVDFAKPDRRPSRTAVPTDGRRVNDVATCEP
jgi:hypothetical protein